MLSRALIASLLTLSASVAFGQDLPPTPAYPTLTIGAAAAPPDAAALAAWDAIRAAVAAKSEPRLAALLAPDFTALSCSSDPTMACAPGRVRAAPRAKGGPLATLKVALCCGGRDDPTISAKDRTEAMFGLLDSILQGGKPAASPELAESVCLPAIPSVDRSALAAISKRLDIDSTNLRAAATPIEARGRPDRTAPVLTTLPAGAVVPVVTAQAVRVPDGWSAFALPAGGVGFAEGVTLDELAPESVCIRRAKDGWRLAILIGRQS